MSATKSDSVTLSVRSWCQGEAADWGNLSDNVWRSCKSGARHAPILAWLETARPLRDTSARCSAGSGHERSMSLSHPARLLLLWLLACGTAVSAAQPASPATDQTVRGSGAVSPTGSTPLRLTGTLQTYDADERFVAVETASGKVRLSVTPESRIRQGRRTVEASVLRTRIGSRVVVRYVESDRGRVVVSLTVFWRATDAPQ